MKFILDEWGALKIFPQETSTVGGRRIMDLDELETYPSRIFSGMLQCKEEHPEIYVNFMRGKADNSANGYFEIEYDGKSIPESRHLTIYVSPAGLNQINLSMSKRDYLPDHSNGYMIEFYPTDSDKNVFK